MNKQDTKHTCFDDPDCNKKKLHGGLKPKELHTGKYYPTIWIEPVDESEVK